MFAVMGRKGCVGYGVVGVVLGGGVGNVSCAAI